MNKLCIKNKRGWEYTSTNLLGDKRKTMNKNLLHQKSILGRSNTYCLQIPPPSFINGISNYKTEGVSNDKYFTRDFVALNCEGIKAGVTTSNETSKFRATYDKLRPIKLYTKSKTEITKPNLNITHGIINRTSTPMQEIITHKFQKDWIESQMKKMKLTHEKIETNQCNETKTFVLRAYDKTKEEKSIRKLKEFQDKATSALSTFRSEECRKRAVEMDQNEKVSRIGFDGHGIQRTRECA